MPRMIIFDLVEFAFICLALISQRLFGATGAISGDFVRVSRGMIYVEI